MDHGSQKSRRGKVLSIGMTQERDMINTQVTGRNNIKNGE